jgi:hypothetical protein
MTKGVITRPAVAGLFFEFGAGSESLTIGVRLTGVPGKIVETRTSISVRKPVRFAEFREMIAHCIAQPSVQLAARDGDQPTEIEAIGMLMRLISSGIVGS